MHVQQRTLKVSVLFPDHAKRIDSPEHHKVREQLILVERRPCFICGRTVDDLAAQFKAKAGLTDADAHKLAYEYLEVHHLWAEYAEYDDIDVSRVQADHPIFAQYNTEGQYDDKDSLAGSLILCAVHHRGVANDLYPNSKRAGEEGIHDSDFPTWLMQKFVKDADLDQYIPGVVVIRKDISDEDGYLQSFLDQHYEKRPVRAVPKPEPKRKPSKSRKETTA